VRRSAGSAGVPAETRESGAARAGAGQRTGDKAGAGNDEPPARGTLYVVATPIGNLGDVTLRALDVLRSVPLVAAEDTRMTRRLWARHGITTPLVSYHARNAARREPELFAHLEAGRDLGVVTDAGTPLVSDPGEGLVAGWAARGGRVVPVPGPSAVLAALVASGIAGPRWGFEGFLPRRGSERRERLARIAADERATVLFEAPGRTAATLRDLAAACGAERAGALCRELTKLHEEVRRGSLAELAASAEVDGPRGEVVLVVAGRVSASTSAAGASRTPIVSADGVPALADGRARVEELVGDGVPRSAAARRVAAETGLPRRELFRRDARGPSDRG
jgi:16S rRNA (cytidine1402-2'-O)-methyltransferase